MNSKRCKVGVPQGSKLGLVLSLVMVNNLMMIFKQEALFDEIPSFSTNSWPKRNFDNISANFRGMYCFERLELSVTYSLIALMQLEISSENLFYAANIRGNNLLQLFILSKRFGWICGSVLLYVKLPWNFPLRFESSAWPMLFATMATLSVSIVSMRLGSFTYSTFGKLFYKKTKKPLHKQGLHPAEIPKALKRDGLLGFTTRIIWKLHLTSFVVNLPRLGRPQKLSMEANSVCINCAK